MIDNLNLRLDLPIVNGYNKLTGHLVNSMKGNTDVVKGECQMSLEILEAKEAIREVIDGFANLECDVPAQMAYFTEDVHVMVYMGGKLTMDIHGRDTLEKQFSAFTGGIKASHHQNGQQVITVEGNKATDVHYCRAALVMEENGRDMVSDNYIRYTDKLVKQEGKWLIKEREQHFVITKKGEL